MNTKKRIILPETREKMRQSLKGKRPKNLDWLHKINKGSRHGNWRGNSVKFGALHDWVRRWKKMPTICNKCRAPNKKLTWANIDHKYRRKLEDFIALCYKCHQQFDKENNSYPIKNHNQFS